MATRRPYTLIVAPRASAQVENIRAYLAERNPTAARRVVGAIRGAFESLRKRPFMGRIGDVEGSREWSGLNYPYVIVYYVAEDRRVVEIAGVFLRPRIFTQPISISTSSVPLDSITPRMSSISARVTGW